MKRIISLVLSIVLTVAMLSASAMCVKAGGGCDHVGTCIGFDVKANCVTRGYTFTAPSKDAQLQSSANLTGLCADCGEFVYKGEELGMGRSGFVQFVNLVDSVVRTPLIKHVFNGELRTKATCAEPATRYCSNTILEYGTVRLENNTFAWGPVNAFTCTYYGYSSMAGEAATGNHVLDKEEVIKKATLTKDGELKRYCSKCNGFYFKKVAIPRPKYIQLYNDKGYEYYTVGNKLYFLYTGKEIKVGAKLFDRNGDELRHDTAYNDWVLVHCEGYLTYPGAAVFWPAMRAPGSKTTHTNSVEAWFYNSPYYADNEGGTYGTDYRIGPDNQIKKVEIKRKSDTKINVKLTVYPSKRYDKDGKVHKDRFWEGYDIVYSTDKDFKDYKIARISKRLKEKGTVNKDIKGLKKNTKYYFKVRAYERGVVGQTYDALGNVIKQKKENFPSPASKTFTYKTSVKSKEFYFNKEADRCSGVKNSKELLSYSEIK